ncbi:MAG: sensor histidine kinase [Chloroflexi bacterium]|nr:sensor histidine kinase [Chloroflexota bacterium]
MRPAPPSLQNAREQELHFNRPFLWLVIIGLIVTYVYTVVLAPDVRQPLPLLTFTALLLVAAWLHLQFLNLRVQARWLIPYLLLQGVLAFLATLIGNSLSITLGLMMMLIGEGLGALGFNRRGVLIGLYYLVLSAASVVLISGGESLPGWVLFIIPSVVVVIAFVWVFERQIAAREQIQTVARELDAANRQLTEYAAQVEDLTLATERQRMARELHDTLSQGLAGLILQLEAVDSHLSRGRTDKAQSIVQQAMDRARTTLADARRVIDDLRATDQAPIDLAGVIRAEVDHFSAASGLPCEVEVTVRSELSAVIGDNVLRMISEALTNIARHAKATRVQLQLRSTDQTIELLIRDDGCGFDPRVIGQPGHYGLIGLQERVRALGGTLSIDSQSGHGTTLKMNVPL